ncbi:MAG: non-canonical purine NTP pyrophosphatase [Nanoarchaeales archaeon]|nr:non-canonical purine NTP pyrophosphatase [Nanoarchaeales archaeon]
MEKDIIFVTGNKNKLIEVSEILGYQIKNKNVDLPEIQAINVIDVVREKVKVAYEILKVPVLVEDTGIYFNTLNKYPGALIKWLLDSTGDVGIYNSLAAYKDKSATAQTIVGTYDGKEYKFYSGEMDGTIVEPRGELGFGWDKIFEISKLKKTVAELTKEEKNKISMRKIAFENFKNGIFLKLD